MSIFGDIEGAAADAVPGVGTIRAIVTGLKVAAVAVPLIGWAITAHTLGAVRDWQATVVAATSTASHLVDKAGRPVLIAAKDVPAQIGALGSALEQVRLKTAQAQADDAAHAESVSAAQQSKTKEHDDDLQAQLATARIHLADYARRMQAPHADGGISRAGGGGAADVPAVPLAPSLADGPGDDPFVPVSRSDLEICSANTVKLKDAASWGADQAIIPR